MRIAVLKELTEKQEAVLQAIGHSAVPLTPTAIAEESGVNYNTVRTYVRRFEDAGVIVGSRDGTYTLASGMRLPDNAAKESRDCPPMVRVPLVRIRLEGDDVVFDEQVKGHVAYHRGALAREIGHAPIRLVLVVVPGDAMAPTLQPADRILVGLQSPDIIIDGSIYIVAGPRGSVLIRRARWQEDGQLCLASDHPDGTSFVIDPRAPDSPWRVVGRVLRVERSL